MNVNKPIYCAVDEDGEVLNDGSGKHIISTNVGIVEDIGELYSGMPFYIAELCLVQTITKKE